MNDNRTSCEHDLGARRLAARDAFAKLLRNVTYKNWGLCVACDESRDGAIFLQWDWFARCSKSGQFGLQSSRKWYLSEHATHSEVVLTAFKAALTAEEHECRENFKFQGKRILGPHIDIYALLQVCEMEDARRAMTP